MKLLIVQHGDFADAYQRFGRGEPETYRDQRRSVEFVTGLAAKNKTTTVSVGKGPYQTQLKENLFAAGVPRAEMTARRVSNLFDWSEAEAVLLRTPYTVVLREANRRRLPILPCFADLFTERSLLDRLRSRRLRRLLAAPNVVGVANHSLNASRSLVDVIGCPPDRIVPWDWQRLTVSPTVKTGVADPKHPTALFAGSLLDAKGVGDCLDAVAHIIAAGRRITFEFAGPGDIDRWRGYADRLGVGDNVRFLGRIPNHELRALMPERDFVVVPSRHSYPEGLPNVIYEGLASRSAIVVSDHPAFRGRLQNDDGCVMFPAGDGAGLASALLRVCDDPELYSTLSANAPDNLERLYVGMEWETLVRSFLDDPGNTTGWVGRNSMSALGLVP